jgi:hypothetical protein
MVRPVASRVGTDFQKSKIEVNNRVKYEEDKEFFSHPTVFTHVNRWAGDRYRTGNRVLV